MPHNSAYLVGRWTDKQVKLLGFFFGPDSQMEKNWDKTSKMTTITHLRLKRKLSLKSLG